MSKSSPEKMFERNLLQSLVSHVSAYAKSHNNLSVCTKSRINPQVALHDVKFSIRCAHKLTPVSYANFEIFFEKCVQLRGKIYLLPQDRKTNGTKNSCMFYLLTIFGDLNKQTIIASSYTRYSVWRFHMWNVIGPIPHYLNTVHDKKQKGHRVLILAAELRRVCLVWWEFFRCSRKPFSASS